MFFYPFERGEISKILDKLTKVWYVIANTREEGGKYFLRARFLKKKRKKYVKNGGAYVGYEIF